MSEKRVRRGGAGWPVDVTLPDGQVVRAVLRGQRRDEPTGRWQCLVAVTAWGPDRPTPHTAAWSVPSEAIGRLPDVAYTGVPTMEPYRPPAWRTTSHTDPALRTVHYYDCPAGTDDSGLVVPARVVRDLGDRAHPCPRCRPPLPFSL